MEEARPSPRSPFWGPIANALARAKYLLNPTDAPGHLSSPFRAGDLLLGQAPEEVERWATGFSPFTVSPAGTASRLPSLSEKRKGPVLDAVSSLPVGTAAKGGTFVLGAMKPRGGAWLPSTTRVLTEAMFRPSPHVDMSDPASVSARYAALDRMVYNWLNRYAGTDVDPIKDVVPHMWRNDPAGRIEDVTDEAFTAFRPDVWKSFLGDVDKSMIGGREGLARDLLMLRKAGHRAPESNVYGFKFQGDAAEQNIYDLARHVGDTLRDISTDELKRWDFPRAVRETVQRDEARLKKGAKGSLEGTAPYKQYPDSGYQWVEVKSPEALDREGKVMGHCVGSYCEQVKEGNSIIYSLRDPKGESHVTVEATPLPKKSAKDWWLDLPAAKRQEVVDQIYGTAGLEPPPWEQAMERGFFEAVGFWPAYEDYLRQPKALEIVQIKGKQNRKPVKEYIPFVQDFVKTGNWYDVYDLQNADMWKVGLENLTTDELRAAALREGWDPTIVQTMAPSEIARRFIPRRR